MKKQLIILVILFNCFISVAQTATCLFEKPANFYTQTGFSSRRASNTTPANTQNIVLNIQFHTVYGTNGYNQHNVNESHYFKMVEFLNVEFNPLGIYFKYRGFNSFNDDEFQSSETAQDFPLMVQEFKDRGLYNYNAINVFYNAEGIGGLSGHGSGNSATGELFLTPNMGLTDVLRWFICHEMGHTLGLSHLDSAGKLDITDNLPSCLSWDPSNPVMVPIQPYGGLILNATDFYPLSENVTRDPLNPKYNADIAGDRVEDTGAAFFVFTVNFCKTSIGGCRTNWNFDPRVVDNSGDINTKCFYCFGTETKYSHTLGNNFYTTLHNGISNDVLLGNNTWQNLVDTTLSSCTSVRSGEMYSLQAERDNFMVNTFQGGNCFANFTPGQGVRMREHVLNVNNVVFNTKLNLTDDNNPDYMVLYEPFAISDGSNNNSSTNTIAYSKTYIANTANTGANVWNCGPFTMRFQTGFECEFYSGNNLPLLKTPDQQYNITTGTGIGIKIPSLSATEIYYNAAPVCFGSFEPYTSGNVKSIDNLGIGTYTQEELDRLKASDPALYEELQSGKYHIITKQTDSGFINQKVIRKD